MTEQAALLAAIAAQPECDIPRLVYADFLDEQPSSGTMTCPKCRGNRGEGKREYKEFGGEERWWEKCPKCDGTGTVADTANHDRAEFIRVQIELAGQRQGKFIASEQNDRRQDWLERRERELLDRHRAEWSRLPCPTCDGSGEQTWATEPPDMVSVTRCSTCGGTGDLFSGRTMTFSRGFPESVSCTLEEVGREEVCPCRRHNGGTSTRVGSCQTCNDRGLVWRLSEWSKAVVKAVPVVKFVPTDVEAWQGVSGDWYAISPNIRRDPAGLKVWHEIHSNGRYHTKEAAESALPVALGRLVRAEVYGKAVKS